MKTTTKFNYAASILIIVTICGLLGNTVVRASQVTGSPLIPSGGVPFPGTVADFNGDGHPDFVLRNFSTRQTAIWYLNNNVLIGTAFGPTVPPQPLVSAGCG